MQCKRMTTPPLFAVYVEVHPYPNCGFTGIYTSRLGPALDQAGVDKLIADDRRAMGDTFGGLIEPARGKRTYRVFRSAGWKEVTNG